ncbi:hypothetical protein BST97_10800 [Nonlabens spongiae]|uniref:Chromosome partitioning protein ParA n=1 Tax=Nonlabens spongiae TaxID=331648 RepID=A0A1W6MLF8_9FLAO|nr:hypothetical protein [Nonlabens spongiae]ARN78435.1 hypothetical protein BST97_10800 [Nonlabens spongiae]
MTSSSDNRIYKVLVVVLILMLAALAIWSYSTFNENEDIMEALTDEKMEIQKELDNISNEYALELEKGTLLSNDLEDARERINRLVDSVDRLEGSVELLAKLRREFAKIKVERDELREELAVLKSENAQLVAKNDSTLQVLNTEVITSIKKSDSINMLTDNMNKAAVLMPVNFETKSYIVRSSGRQVENDRARRVDALNTCFTLPNNTLAEQGVQTLYLQIINPENNVVGARKKIKFGDQELTYSKEVQFNYKGEELKICEMIDLPKEMRESGNYRINLFRDSERLATQVVSLR